MRQERHTTHKIVKGKTNNINDKKLMTVGIKEVTCRCVSVYRIHK